MSMSDKGFFALNSLAFLSPMADDNILTFINTLLQLSPSFTITNNWRSHSWHFITACAEEGHHLWIQQQWNIGMYWAAQMEKLWRCTLSLFHAQNVQDFWRLVFGSGSFLLDVILVGLSATLCYSISLIADLTAQAAVVSSVIECSSFIELDKVNPLDGQTAIFSSQTAVLIQVGEL